MAEEIYPTWLEGHIKRYEHKRLPTVTLCSSSGNDLLEVYYYGDMFQVKGESQPYIGATDTAPLLIVAKDSRSDEEFVVFDEGKHGYNSMVCESFDATQMSKRKLTRLDIPASKLVIELGYSIDYEDEKEYFDVDENDKVELVNGNLISWEQLKRDGIDYIALFYVNESGQLIQFVDIELA